MTELVNAIKAKGKVPGIYATYYMWQEIMGSANSCTGLSNVALWYANWNGRETFSDFAPFGGWTKPNMKQHTGDTKLCNFDVDLNFY